MKASNASVLRNALRAVAAVAALAPFGAGAQLVNHLQPMAFLAGHCWKGEFPDGAQSDEHCFQWLYGDKALRDVHTVRAPGMLVFSAARYASGGNEVTLRVKWTVLDAERYEAWSEAKDKDAWSTMFKVTMKKVS